VSPIAFCCAHSHRPEALSSGKMATGSISTTPCSTCRFFGLVANWSRCSARGLQSHPWLCLRGSRHLNQALRIDACNQWIQSSHSVAFNPRTISKKKTLEQSPGVPRFVPRASPTRLKSRRVENVCGRRRSHRPEHQGRSGVQSQHLSVPQ